MCIESLHQLLLSWLLGYLADAEHKSATEQINNQVMSLFTIEKVKAVM
jgi:hypothetical protein